MSHKTGPVTITLDADVLREVTLALHDRMRAVAKDRETESAVVATIAGMQLGRCADALDAIREALGEN